MAKAKKKSLLFSKIETRDDALKIIREASFGFFFIAILQALIGTLVLHDIRLLYDVVVYVVGGLFLWKANSRVAAVVLFLVALLALGVTISNLGFAIAHKTNAHSVGGTNVIVALIILWAAIRAVEATFKLHGRFALPKTNTSLPQA